MSGYDFVGNATGPAEQQKLPTKENRGYSNSVNAIDLANLSADDSLLSPSLGVAPVIFRGSAVKTKIWVATLKTLETIRSTHRVQRTEMHQMASYSHKTSTTALSCPHSSSKIMNNATICAPNSRPKLEARSQCDVHSSPFLHWSPIPLLFLWTVLLPPVPLDQYQPSCVPATVHLQFLPSSNVPT